MKSTTMIIFAILALCLVVNGYPVEDEMNRQPRMEVEDAFGGVYDTPVFDEVKSNEEDNADDKPKKLFW